MSVEGSLPMNGDVVDDEEKEKGPLPDGDELELLRKLELANNELENDVKFSLCHQPLFFKDDTSETSSDSHLNGFSANSADGEKRSRSGSMKREEKLDDVTKKWGDIIKNFDEYAVKKPKQVKDLVYAHPVPDICRPIAWQLLSGAIDSHIKEEFPTLMKQVSPFDKAIRRDIARTFPDVNFFQNKNGQESLFNVMKAFSLHDQEIGYCQGSGFIVGLLLLQMPEEDAFAVFVQLMTHYGLRDLFKPSMTELGRVVFQLEQLLVEYSPNVSRHMSGQGLYLTMFASQWFLALFCTIFPTKMTARVMDLFLCDGLDFLFSLGLALMTFQEQNLLQMDMEEICSFFSRENLFAMFDSADEQPLNPAAEELIQTALRIKIPAKRMKKWEKEYTQIKAREQEDAVELRRLRTENRLLRQRVDALERESASIADKLLASQVEQASAIDKALQTGDELAACRRELTELRRQHGEATDELRVSRQRIEKLENQLQSEQSCNQPEAFQELYNELVSLKVKNDEADEIATRQQERLNQLESVNRRLAIEPNSEIAALQEELTTIKLRESAQKSDYDNLAAKLTSLQNEWNVFREKKNESIEESSGESKVDGVASDGNDVVMRLRMSEAELSNRIIQTNRQLQDVDAQKTLEINKRKRAEREVNALKEKHDALIAENESNNDRIRELESRLASLQCEESERALNARIDCAEHLHQIEMLRQRCATLEYEQDERQTRTRIRVNANQSEDATQSSESLSYRPSLNSISEEKRKRSSSTDGPCGSPAVEARFRTNSSDQLATLVKGNNKEAVNGRAAPLGPERSTSLSQSMDDINLVLKAPTLSDDDEEDEVEDTNDESFDQLDFVSRTGKEDASGDKRSSIDSSGQALEVANGNNNNNDVDNNTNISDA